VHENGRAREGEEKFIRRKVLARSTCYATTRSVYREDLVITAQPSGRNRDQHVSGRVETVYTARCEGSQ
jgi:hypothetical protein